MATLKNHIKPWQVTLLNIKNERGTQVPTLAVIDERIRIGETATPVCLVTPLSQKNETDEIHAALISAAPELLQVALAIIKRANHDKNGFLTIQEISEHAAKAIKKATMRTRGYYSEPGMADRCVLIWEQEGFRARWVEETETESPYRYRIETWESF